MTLAWKECCEKTIAKRIRPDKDVVSALQKASENKMASCDSLGMTEVTAASKISLAYDSLRELLEALAVSKGYKIYNHECYTAFLKEAMKLSAEGDVFDDIRKVRNAVNYYGKSVSAKDAEKLIGKIKKLHLFIKGKLSSK